jgi:hypothetical protein
VLLACMYDFMYVLLNSSFFCVSQMVLLLCARLLVKLCCKFSTVEMSQHNGMNSIKTVSVSNVCSVNITEVTEGSVKFCCMNSGCFLIKIICDVLLW